MKKQLNFLQHTAFDERLSWRACRTMLGRLCTILRQALDDNAHFPKRAIISAKHNNPHSCQPLIMEVKQLCGFCLCRCYHLQTYLKGKGRCWCSPTSEIKHIELIIKHFSLKKN